MKKYKYLAILLGFLILSGCAVVTSDADGIEIRHSAENNLLVQRKADNHCEKFGKKAIRVQVSPISDEYLVRSVVSTFKCVN